MPLYHEFAVVEKGSNKNLIDAAIGTTAFKMINRDYFL